MRGLRFDATLLFTYGSDYDMIIWGAVILVVVGGLAIAAFHQQGIIDELRAELEELRQNAVKQEEGSKEW